MSALKSFHYWYSSALILSCSDQASPLDMTTGVKTGNEGLCYLLMMDNISLWMPLSIQSLDTSLEYTYRVCVLVLFTDIAVWYNNFTKHLLSLLFSFTSVFTFRILIIRIIWGHEHLVNWFLQLNELLSQHAL